ncbi:MAG: Uma2 family endonuclease [Isosphaeraceae bacterium]|nr:Uma2 family endonuclease [Isosphaeraceae bacterium]
MATTDDPRSAESEERARQMFGPGPRRLRWTADQYYRLAELGFFRNRRVELIGGDIIEMSAVKPPHSIGIDLLGDALRAAFGPGHRVRIQQPLDMGRRTQPEPDAAVVAGEARDFIEHPTTALLVVEVSDSSLRYDRRVKSHYYAHAGIADYWIVNLIDRQLEIYRKPGPDPSRAGRLAYAEVTIVPPTGSASPPAKPDAVIAVVDLLP